MSRSMLLYGATGLLWGFFLFAAGLSLSEWSTWAIALWPSVLAGITRGITLAEVEDSDSRLPLRCTECGGYVSETLCYSCGGKAVPPDAWVR